MKERFKRYFRALDEFAEYMSKDPYVEPMSIKSWKFYLERFSYPLEYNHNCKFFQPDKYPLVYGKCLYCKLHKTKTFVRKTYLYTRLRCPINKFVGAFEDFKQWLNKYDELKNYLYEKRKEE